ncbi:MAG: hypothetical protein AAF471_03415 [Myxococcota bacterium]
MALRQSLVPVYRAPDGAWWWHHLKWASVSARRLCVGERRLDAGAYLSSGYGTRVALEAERTDWTRLGAAATIWQPGRLKGIHAPPGQGTPFLAAEQVFDLRPRPRKWLVFEKTPDARRRFVSNGTILVTRSGTAGRVTLAREAHENKLISDDLLRIDVTDADQWGWIYAFLLAPTTRAMLTAACYGQVIKHVEVSHLADLPLPLVADETARACRDKAARVLELRNACHRLTLTAESRFAKAVGGAPDPRDWGEEGFSIRVSRVVKGRRRLDAWNHVPAIAAITAHLARRGKKFTSVADAGYQVWVPGRYKRVAADDGVVYWSSADLPQVAPNLTKRIADCDFGDSYRGRVQQGWVLLLRSGGVRGSLGRSLLATKTLHEQLVSDHVMRLAPGQSVDMPGGYLLTALSHPTLGLPLVKALACGSTVQEIAVEDVAALPVVRVDPAEERAIAALVEQAAECRAEADALERELADDADRIITARAT